MKDKGQIQLSFSMIFSIILIVVVVFVAGYMLVNFIKSRDCIQVGTFYKSLNDEVERVYRGQGAHYTFSGVLPSSISQVCFGTPDQTASSTDKVRQDYFKQRGMTEFNLFFYPPPQSCAKKYIAYKIEHAATSDFFCVSPKSGKIGLTISKEDIGSPVMLIK